VSPPARAGAPVMAAARTVNPPKMHARTLIIAGLQEVPAEGDSGRIRDRPHQGVDAMQRGAIKPPVWPAECIAKRSLPFRSKSRQETGGLALKRASIVIEAMRTRCAPVSNSRRTILNGRLGATFPTNAHSGATGLASAACPIGALSRNKSRSGSGRELLPRSAASAPRSGTKAVPTRNVGTRVSSGAKRRSRNREVVSGRLVSCDMGPERPSSTRRTQPGPARDRRLAPRIRRRRLP
jgi:hypothetical protein